MREEISVRILCRVMAQDSLARSFYVSQATAPQPNLPLQFPGSSPPANVAGYSRAFLLEPSPFFLTLRPASMESTSKFGFGSLTSKLRRSRHRDSGGLSSPWRCWGLCLGILCIQPAPPSIRLYVWMQPLFKLQVYSLLKLPSVFLSSVQFMIHISCVSYKLYDVEFYLSSP
jgi:hypothetical protein